MLRIPSLLQTSAAASTTLTGSGMSDGAVMGGVTVMLTVLLELLSIPGVRGIRAKKGGRSLYAKGVASNLLNNLCIGPITYHVAVELFCRPATRPFLTTTLGMLAVHAVGYYIAHRAMHLKWLYWAHRFHHRFNTHVVPSTANAVTLAEYGIAYMLPFIAGGALLRPDGVSLFACVAVVSLNNLLIHTPCLESLSTLLPPIFVSTDRHIDHHRRLTTHYGAPTISVDWILATIFGEGHPILSNKYASKPE
jgi:sterol desaturase/sphingolipid hydroxylase (fatty acid hydroxylase superfamily)